MRIPSTTTFAALAALTAIPAAFAQEAAEPVMPEVSICIENIQVEEPFIIECPGLEEGSESVDPIEDITEPTGKEEEVVTEEPTDSEVVDFTNEEEGSDPEVDVEFTEWPEGGVPIEWVKRGGGELDNPDVIFYSMAGGPELRNLTGAPSPEANESTSGSATRVLNQGETAADIEKNVTSGAGVAKAAKKSTVAIVKEGRVFLR